MPVNMLSFATLVIPVLNVRTLDTDEEGVGEEGDVWYTLTITNLETKRMFRKIVNTFLDQLVYKSVPACIGPVGIVFSFFINKRHD